MGGKLSKKKKGYNVNDEKAKDKDKKAEGAWTEEEGTRKENETQAAALKSNDAPASDTKPGSFKAALSSKETPAVTEAPSFTAKAQTPAAPADEVKLAETPAANFDQT
uniref:Brain acid soluble protein 1 n=2 Tax=Sus scrofa TaxID=9823 RepID=A0A8D0YMF0_PIG